MTLTELADRCERAVGPDRELDQDIHEIVVIRSALSGTIYPYSKKYTASIDAAMTLVPDQWNVSLRGFGQSWNVVMNDMKTGPMQQSFSHASTPALAICAAALRATEQVRP